MGRARSIREELPDGEFLVVTVVVDESGTATPHALLPIHAVLWLAMQGLRWDKVILPMNALSSSKCCWSREADRQGVGATLCVSNIIHLRIGKMYTASRESYMDVKRADKGSAI